MALETAGNLYANDLFKPKLLPKKCNEYIYIYIIYLPSGGLMNCTTFPLNQHLSKSQHRISRGHSHLVPFKYSATSGG